MKRSRECELSEVQEMCSSSFTDVESPAEGPRKPSTTISMWEQAFRLCVSYLHIHPSVKICYYAITLVIFSMVHDSADLPHIEVLTGKHSILNQMFVKQGWGITLAAYVTYQLISLSIHQKRGPSLRRLIVGATVTTFFFFIWCQVIFPFTEHLTSACTTKNIRVNLGKRECLRRKNHVYHSFDISGHSYLLTYCVLVIMEESKGVLYYLWLGEYLRGTGTEGWTADNDELQRPCWTRPEWSRPDRPAQTLQMLYPWVSPLVSISFIVLVVLALLWDFMIIVTTIYYHTFLEKILGTILAVMMWYLIYGRVFKDMAKWKIFLS